MRLSIASKQFGAVQWGNDREPNELLDFILVHEIKDCKYLLPQSIKAKED